MVNTLQDILDRVGDEVKISPYDTEVIRPRWSMDGARAGLLWREGLFLYCPAPACTRRMYGTASPRCTQLGYTEDGCTSPRCTLPRLGTPG